MDGPRYADAYQFAAFLAARFGADTLIDVGCASPFDLIAITRLQKVVVGSSQRIDQVRRAFGRERLVTHDAGVAAVLPLEEETLHRSVVIAAGGLDLAGTDRAMARLLTEFSRAAKTVVVTTRPGQTDMAAADARLHASGATPSFVGLTASGSAANVKDACIAVIDGFPISGGRHPPASFRPLVITTTYNDADIVREMLTALLDDGFDVHVIDNWSTDDTFAVMKTMRKHYPQLTLERFPECSPSRYFELQAMLRRKQVIAAEHAGRWIVHHDSDEIRCAPWKDVSLRGGLYLVDTLGFSAVDFSICEFRPVSDQFRPDAGLQAQLKHFGFPPHSRQIKVWRQGIAGVDIATTAGHEAQFEGRRVFPYNFVLKHYPFRSPEQARRKIVIDRRERYPPHERALLWHTHNDRWTPDETFKWNAGDLRVFDDSTKQTHMVELLSGIGTEPRGDVATATTSRLDEADLIAPAPEGDSADLKMPRGASQQRSRLGRGLSAASFLTCDDVPQSPWIEHAPFLSWVIDAQQPRAIAAAGPSADAALRTARRIAEQLGQQIDFGSRLPLEIQDSVAFERKSTPGVDLLLASGDAVVDRWRTQLSARAVVVVLGQRGSDAGGTCFDFVHAGGLGVIALGPDIDDRLRPLFDAAGDAGAAADIRIAYARLGSAWSDRAARLNQRRLLAAKDETLRQRALETARLSGLLLAVRTEEETRVVSDGQIGNQLLASRAATEAVQAELTLLRASTSWRLTAPIRWGAYRWPRLAATLRRLMTMKRA